MPETNVCHNHTGHEEKIKGVGGKLTQITILLYTLISLFISSIGFLFMEMKTTNSNLSDLNLKVAVMEVKLKSNNNSTNQGELK